MIPRIKPIKKKSLENIERGVYNGKYKEWRNYVVARDGGKCQFQGCGATTNLEVHHIRKFSKYPHLRFDTNNGITVCAMHHKKCLTHREESYEFYLSNLALANEKKYKSDSGHKGTESP